MKKYLLLSSILSLSLLANVNQTKLNYKQNENVDISNYVNLSNDTKIQISNDLYKYLSFENEYEKEIISNCKILNNKYLNCDTKINFDIVLDIEGNGILLSKNFKLLNIDEKPLQKDLLYDDLIGRNADINIENQKLTKEMEKVKEENNLLRGRIDSNIEFNNKIVVLEQQNQDIKNENSELKKENDLLKKRNINILNNMNQTKEIDKNIEVIDENVPKLNSKLPLSKNIEINRILDSKKVVKKNKIKKVVKKNEVKIEINNESLKNILNNNFI
jgi:hypothetical protein